MTRRVLWIGLALAAVLPLVALLLASLGAGWFWPAPLPARLDLEPWRSLAGGTGAGARLGPAGLNSIVLAAGTGLASAALALPIGRVLARLGGWKRYLGAAAAFLPVAAPPLALGVGLQYTFLRLGLAGQMPGVFLAHLVPALGYTSLFFLGVFSTFDDRIEDEARTLGAGRWQTFTRVTLPLLRRPLIEAFVLGFLVSWAQVPLTMIIGQGLVPTVAVEVLAYLRAGQDRLAATGAILLVVPPLLTMAAAAFAIRRTEAIAL
jgi:putative spermidine/putrescine transport system permease protein